MVPAASQLLVHSGEGALCMYSRTISPKSVLIGSARSFVTICVMMPLGRAVSRPQEIPWGLGFKEASGNVCAELSVGFASIMAAVSAPGAVRGAQQRVSTKSQVNPLMMALSVGVGVCLCRWRRMSYSSCCCEENDTGVSRNVFIIQGLHLKLTQRGQNIS